MRKWITYTITMMLILVMMGAPAHAGGIVDFGDGFQALTPFFIVNAILTAIVSTLFMQGCAAVGGVAT